MKINKEASASVPGGERRPLHVLHVYRRFHPDYTGDGIYYTHLQPLLESDNITGEFLAFETQPPGPGAVHFYMNNQVTYISATILSSTSIGLCKWIVSNRSRIDIMHLHSHVDRFFLSYLGARIFGIRVIYSCTLNDSPTELLNQYRPAYRRFVALLMRTISPFVVISPHLLRRSLESVPLSRVRFIPQGVTLSRQPQFPDDRLRARERLGIPPDAFVVLTVGSVSRRKNIRFLLECFAELEHSDDFLVVVGPVLEPEYMNELQKFITDREINGKLLFTGFVDNPTDYYIASDVFVFSSNSEGFGNVLLEAMAQELPIISKFLPGITDFILDHGHTALLASDHAQFTEALRSLRADPRRRASMGRAGRAFVQRNLDLASVAGSYAELYRSCLELGREARETKTEVRFPDLNIRFTSALALGPESVGLREFDIPANERPVLQVVIDTEAGFEWDKGIWTDVGKVDSIVGLRDCFDIFRNYGVRPALVVDYPIITGRESSQIIRNLAAEGCEIGVHLHAWNTPPTLSPMDDWHSFSGNLGPGFERMKIEELARRIEDQIGERPRTFKSGRYGLGPNTIDSLMALGFTTDLSICPAFDYSSMGGPDFTHFSSRPGWFGAPKGLLSLPTTAGWLGWLAGSGERLSLLLGSRPGRIMRLRHLAARTNAFYPVRLSPEGNDLETIKRLTLNLYNAGLRVFTLSMHSPTFQTGNTPYSRSDAELARIVNDTNAYLAFFRDELGGTFATPSEIRRRLTSVDVTFGSRRV